MTRPIRSLRDAIDELGKADARIEALEAALTRLYAAALGNEYALTITSGEYMDAMQHARALLEHK